MKELSNSLPDRSIGKKLKSFREAKAFSIENVASATKIRTEYIEAIEADNFSKFDSHVYAKGFIKNYAIFLNINPEPLIALYRRDFENLGKTRKTQLVSNKTENLESKKIIKKPELTSPITRKKIAYVLTSFFIVSIGIFLMVFLQNLFKPPLLRITSPEFIQDESFKKIETQSKSIRIAGETNPNTLIKVNEEPVPLNPGNIFETDFIPLNSEHNIINIEAQSQLGVKSIVRLEIIRTDLQNQEKVIADAIVQVKEKSIFLLIRADGIIKFNDIAVPNEVVNITANKFIEIETSEPQYVTLQINRETYQLEKSFERFELGDSVNRLN